MKSLEFMEIPAEVFIYQLSAFTTSICNRWKPIPRYLSLCGVQCWVYPSHIVMLKMLNVRYIWWPV